MLAVKFGVDDRLLTRADGKVVVHNKRSGTKNSTYIQALRKLKV